MEIHVKFYSLVRHFGYCSSQACSLLIQFIKFSSLTKIDIFRLSKGKFNMKRSLFIFKIARIFYSINSADFKKSDLVILKVIIEYVEILRYVFVKVISEDIEC